MPSKEYQSVVELLDRGDIDGAITRLYDWVAAGALTRAEFRSLIAAIAAGN